MHCCALNCTQQWTDTHTGVHHQNVFQRHLKRRLHTLKSIKKVLDEYKHSVHHWESSETNKTFKVPSCMTTVYDWVGPSNLRFVERWFLQLLEFEEHSKRKHVANKSLTWICLYSLQTTQHHKKSLRTKEHFWRFFLAGRLKLLWWRRNTGSPSQMTSSHETVARGSRSIQPRLPASGSKCADCSATESIFRAWNHLLSSDLFIKTELWWL